MRTFAAFLACASIIGLAGCDGQTPLVASTTSSSESSPDLTGAQEKAIRKRILKGIDSANSSRDSTGLDSFMSGPALAIRTSELAIAKATGELDPKTTIPSGGVQTVIPTNSGWPRSVFTITTTTKDQQSKRLLVLRQDSARGNYRLWAVARLFEGAQMPKFAIPSIGSSLGDVDDSGLVMTPETAVERYADVLQNGTGSDYATQFSDDYFRQDLTTLAKTVQKGMEQNKGTQSQTFTAVRDAITVMRSSDGGDLVVARIDSEWVRKAGEGRQSLPASDAEKALFGSGKATSTMKVSYVNVVALYVPPAGSGKQVVAVGAERQPVSVKAS
ncbi:hypothetical protein [uncultured Bifidobacterium sp.]|uniref:hypothetical protein n=1 Tax=uncultured Bifidobacterium sp. TaxID=165187 RepID=UPI0026311AA6|nr:hypothetical protein [uncultured Bifidobacterium sp.]